MRRTFVRVVMIPGILPMLLLARSSASQELSSPEPGELRYGRLIAATTTMATAWDIPRNPLTDSILAPTPHADTIRWGFRIFMETPREASRFASNRLSCNNCHLNGGQRELALPLVGVAGAFPEYNKRSGRVFTLEDRIIGCFMRSENATGTERATGEVPTYPDSSSAEVIALAAYLRWLSDGVPAGAKLPWRGRNVIPAEHLLAMDKLNPIRGRRLFLKNCITCHGRGGQGVQVGDKKAGPLWGPHSWNDGAGAARIYTLAGFIRYSMPYLNPGSLTDEEAQHIAAFINSKSRPVYPFKARDYQTTGVPADAVYYRTPQRGAAK